VLRLTLWLAIAAAAFVALLLGNAFAYRIRFGTFLKPGAGASGVNAKLTKAQLVTAVFPVTAMFLGFAAPVIAPESLFAQWLDQPYSRPVYYVWCFLAGILVGVAQALYAHFLKGRSHEAN
jgi:hypothetical protein